MQRFLRLLTICFILFAIFTRFCFLTWGYPFFFHPDENNITNAIEQMSFVQWNPHFFAYGGLPLYTTFLVSSLISFGNRNFATIAYTLRFISALLSFLLIPSLFYIGKNVWSKRVGIIAAVLATVSVGFIQFAHFGTFEMWLTFFTLWLFYACVLLYKNPTRNHTLLTGVLVGALLGIKVSSISFVLLPLCILFVQRKKTSLLRNALLYIFTVSTVYLLSNPYFLLDTQSFISSLGYESSVATGTLHVFYTQSFIDTVPVIFQLLYVFPFVLNLPILILFLISIFVHSVQIKKLGTLDIFLILFFGITFFPQAFLFVKWTRYMIPTLPFIYLCISIFISRLQTKLGIYLTVIFFLISLVYSLAFIFITYPQDSRLTATLYAQKNLKGQKAIVEPYDLGALPFNSIFKGQIINLYNLETDSLAEQQLSTALSQSRVFLSVSQRILHARLANPKDFPKGNFLYKSLLNGSLGYTMVYQTSCSLWCQLVFSGNPIQSVEETATVFDHPFVSIFAKQ